MSPAPLRQQSGAMPPEHSAASCPPAWSQVKQPPHHHGESPEAPYGRPIPAKSGQAGEQHQPLAAHSCDLFWGTSFGSARAAQQVGASLQGLLQTHLLSHFVVCEGYDLLPQQPAILPVPCDGA